MFCSSRRTGRSCARVSTSADRRLDVDDHDKHESRQQHLQRPTVEKQHGRHRQVSDTAAHRTSHRSTFKVPRKGTTYSQTGIICESTLGFITRAGVDFTPANYVSVLDVQVLKNRVEGDLWRTTRYKIMWNIPQSDLFLFDFIPFETFFKICKYWHDDHRLISWNFIFPKINKCENFKTPGV